MDDVTFTIEKGKTLGVVGESGCGKSTTGRAILRLIEPTAGEVLFEGQDVVKLSAEEMRKKRTDMQIIFQDPFSSLNPRKTISQIIADPLKINKIITDKNEQMDRVRELMETVGLADRLINTYPHELDGGRRQRIGIARALALNPKFIVCDEPVSALDVSIQAQILNLMKQLQNKMGLTYMFITHDPVSYTHLPEKAKEYLAASGLSPADCTFSIICSDDTKLRAGQVIQSSLKENLGIDVTLESMDLATYLDKTCLLYTSRCV